MQHSTSEKFKMKNVRHFELKKSDLRFVISDLRLRYFKSAHWYEIRALKHVGESRQPGASVYLGPIVFFQKV